jgi:hypothetical protein
MAKFSADIADTLEVILKIDQQARDQSYQIIKEISL